MNIKEPFPQESAGCWGIMGNPEDISQQYPMKGYMIKARWSEVEAVEGVYDWTEMDLKIKSAIKANAKVGLALNIGPDSPSWIYNTVPKILTDKGHGDKKEYSYPFPLDKKGNYLNYVTLLVRALAKYIDKELTPQDQEQILFIQANIGCSGDISYYKGNILKVIDPYKDNPDKKKYEFSEESDEFREYVYDVWSLYIRKFKDTDIKILFNTANDFDKMQYNIPKVIKKYGEYSPMIKCGNPTHGFQLNKEIATSDYLVPFLNKPQENGLLLKARGERGDTKSTFWQEYIVWNEYWLVLYALYHGMDIINYRSQEWKQTSDDGKAKFIHAFEKFDQYAGYDKVSDAPGAFCALRQGIDSDDEKWNEKFGKYDNNASDEEKIARMEKIFNSDENKDNREKRGARFEYPEYAIGGPMKNRAAEGINDIGRKIIRGNYNKFMVQIDPDETSVGWWSVGPKDEPYGRFARGFDTAFGSEMHFKINDNFFKDNATVGSVTIRVIYFNDEKSGSFEVKYSTESGNATAGSVECGSSKEEGEWKIAEFSVDDFSENGTFTQNAQIQLVCTSGEPILHMIEVLK